MSGYVLATVILFVAAVEDLKEKKVSNLIFVIGLFAAAFLLPLRFPGGARICGAVFIFLFGMTGWMGMADIKMWIVADLLIGFLPSVWALFFAEVYLILFILFKEGKEGLSLLRLSMWKLCHRDFSRINQKSYPFIPFYLCGVITAGILHV